MIRHNHRQPKSRQTRITFRAPGTTVPTPGLLRSLPPGREACILLEMVIRDEELHRLESRSRQVAAIALVVTLFTVVTAVVLWVPTMTSPKSAVWDWLYDRHPELIVFLVLAGVVLG